MPQPNKIPKPFAASGDKNTIPESTETIGLASWNEGFPAITSTPFAEGGLAPKRNDFNGIFNALSAATVWQQQGGFYAYDNNTDYEVGNVVEYNNDLYKCLTANGPSSAVKAPTDATVWSKVMTAADTAAAYLPLSGGTMTGNLTFSGAYPAIVVDTTDSYIRINNQGYNGGASMYLNGKDRSTDAGTFSLIAYDGANRKVFGGGPDGKLKWDGNDVITSAGGAMTGDLTNGKNNSEFFRIYGGTNVTTGARLALAPSALSGYEGEFWLVARSSNSGDIALKGRPNGELIWNNHNIAVVDSVDSSNSGYIRFTNGVQFVWANVNVNITSGVAVTFERAFTSVPRIFTNIAFSAAQGRGYEGQAVDRTTTGFSAYIGSSQNGTSTAFATGSLNYLAIGPWA